MGQWRHNSAILDFDIGLRRMVSFTPRPIYHRERAPDTHWIRDWLDSRRCGVAKISGTSLESNPGRPARSYIDSITEEAYVYMYSIAPILIFVTYGSTNLSKDLQYKNVPRSVRQHKNVLCLNTSKSARTMLYSLDNHSVVK
jgi:hypothetical protein